jgi:ribosomal protein L37AE/L43A
MAKGATCPNCGEQTWQKAKQGGRVCSNCNVRGWLGHEAPGGGGGAGKTCKLCGTKTLVRASKEDGFEIRRCTGCGAVVMSVPG